VDRPTLACPGVLTAEAIDRLDPLLAAANAIEDPGTESQP
jgi:hypothetical protein